MDFSDSPCGRKPNTGQIGRIFPWPNVALFAKSKLSYGSRCYSIFRVERMENLPIEKEGLNRATKQRTQWELTASGHLYCQHD